MQYISIILFFLLIIMTIMYFLKNNSESKPIVNKTSCEKIGLGKPKEYVNPNIFPSYIVENRIQYGTTPAEGNIEIINGTLDECKTRCDSNNSCLGFTRQKCIENETVGICYLKNILSGPGFKNIPGYETYRKKSKM